MSLNKKPSVYTDDAASWLHFLSKAALVDCVVDLLRGQSESCDEPVSIAAAKKRLEPVILTRGDKMPTATDELCALRSAERIRLIEDRRAEVRG